MVLVVLSSCGTATETGKIDWSQPSITIHFSFNPKSYPRFIKKMYPQMAVWAVSGRSGFSRTLYVTRAGAKDDWFSVDKRPSALPVWYGVRPAEKGSAVDAVTGATPGGESFRVNWNVPQALKGKPLDILIEANVSFDYNRHFPKRAKKGEPCFSDVNGQPSLVWKARIVPGSKPQTVVPSITGHGHVLGEDNRIDPELSKVTTAKGLFHYIKVMYHPGR